jgi:arabinoxylan arabinofuranohydrolase
VKLKPDMAELDGGIHVVPAEHFTEAAYMTGPSAIGPWTSRGVLVDKNDGVNTIHHAVFDFNGKSYVAYHNGMLPGGGEFRRSVAIEELRYWPDGTVDASVAQTTRGLAANPSPGCQP